MRIDVIECKMILNKLSPLIQLDCTKISIPFAYLNRKISKNLSLIDDKAKEKLEHFAQIGPINEATVKTVQNAIQLADTLQSVNTEYVEPMISPAYMWNSYLREDKVTEDSKRPQLLKLAMHTEEQYYVAPSSKGIMREKQENNHDKTEKSKSVS